MAGGTLAHGQAPPNGDMAPLNEEESSYAADEDEGDITDGVYKFNEGTYFTFCLDLPFSMNTMKPQFIMLNLIT